jgi:subtilisin family serine protease
MWNGGTAYPNHGYNVIDNNNDPMDRSGHGTHVAGIIGAVGNNAKGTTGVCWKASIMAVRVLDASGSGTSATVIQGVNFAVGHGAKVINMSLGGAIPFDQAYSNAITTAQNADVVVVVSAGNDGVDNDALGSAHYPCDFAQPNLLCVAALDQSYALASFSDWGATSVDVGAPGTNILSTWNGTKAVITDTLDSGWLGSSTTAGAGGGWSAYTGGTVNFLTTSGYWSSTGYNNSTDDRYYKSFNLTGSTAASLTFLAETNVANGDHFRVGYVSTATDVFAGAGTIIWETQGATSDTNFASKTFDVSGCISANCTIGFQLQSDASLNDLGVGIAYFSISTFTPNSTSYNTKGGTSMASPEVAGLATMLRAYNPQYTYADVVSAIENAGRPVASLSGKTTTGKAIDVMASLAYISPPTGLTAVVQ